MININVNIVIYFYYKKIVVLNRFNGCDTKTRRPVAPKSK